MKVLYFGDTFGRPGRDAVRLAMVKLMPLHQIDFVVINA
jgi:calcineurin-like phosphoesterase